MSPRNKIQQHIVVFRDEDGTVLKTAFVPHGSKAQAPSMPEKKGETAHHDICFLGWDQDISCVEDNLVAVARYGKVKKKYLVMYLHENGKMLGTESVSYGSPARMPFHPDKADSEEFIYEFAGWNKDLSSVEKDTMVKAVFRRIRKAFRVRFFHEDGTLLKEDRILYGKAARPPAPPFKEKDPVYTYDFSGWDGSFDRITEARDIHASFMPVYRDYRLAFYEEDELIAESFLHYGDRIEYPPLKKKGYHVIWTPKPLKVSGEEELRASYEFSNPKGAVIRDGDSLYEITNPSVERGGVCCLRYISRDRRVKLPERVKLGDYYYRIEEIGERAFSACMAMETLEIPDSVVHIRREGLSGCRRLREISLGKGIHKIDEHAFSENMHLKRIIIKSDSIGKVHRDAFARMDAPVGLFVKQVVYDRRFGIFERALGSGAVEISIV